MKISSALVGVGLTAIACVALAGQASIPGIHPTDKSPARKDKVTMTDAQWKAKLSPEAYNILREAGTEAPFSSPMNKVHVPGTFVSAATGQPLFRTADKFDSGTGWPSFVKPITPTPSGTASTAPLAWRASRSSPPATTATSDISSTTVPPTVAACATA